MITEVTFEELISIIAEQTIKLHKQEQIILSLQEENQKLSEVPDADPSS
jgi:hypothetical protein